MLHIGQYKRVFRSFRKTARYIFQRPADGLTVFIEVLQFNIQYCCLYGIKPAVNAQDLVIILSLRTMGYVIILIFSANSLLSVVIIPRVTKSTQIFAWIKTNAPDITDSAYLPALIFGSKRLSGIFNYKQVIPFWQFPLSYPYRQTGRINGQALLLLFSALSFPQSYLHLYCKSFHQYQRIPALHPKVQ